MASQISYYRIIAPLPFEYVIEGIVWRVGMKFDEAGGYWLCAVTRPGRATIALEPDREQLEYGLRVAGTPIVAGTMLSYLFQHLVRSGMAEEVPVQSGGGRLT